MGSNIDDAKGRVKEAAGALTDDRDLKNEGKADRAGAKAKNVVENVEDKVSDGIDAIKDRFNNDKD